MRELKFGRKGVAPGKAKQLIILVHGYGADGNDLLGLADPLAPHLPEAVFVAPDAPNKCSGNPFGYEWFPIPWLDGSSEELAKVGMTAALSDLNGFIDAQMNAEGVGPAQTLLVGFSQGTMMSLHLAPRRAARGREAIGRARHSADEEPQRRRARDGDGATCSRHVADARSRRISRAISVASRK